MDHGLGCRVIRDSLAAIPRSPGVYKMIGTDGVIIYIGKANDLRNRVSSYAKGSFDSVKTEVMVSQVAKVEIIVTGSEDEALLLESRLIKSLKPKYNILLKDDKSYPFIVIDRSAQFPRIYRSRLSERQHVLAGPFASAYEAHQVLSVVQKVAKIRSCTDSFFKSRTRPCVEHQVGRCSAPCVGKITKEDYAYSVQQAISIFRGNAKGIIDDLRAVMKKSSDEMDYDRALIIRDRIFALEKLTFSNNMTINTSGDYIGLYRHHDYCCAQIFRISGSSIFGNVSYFFENVQEQTDGRLLSALITRHYMVKDVRPLGAIITRSETDDKPLLERSIANKYGIKVKLGLAGALDEDAKQFLEIIERNAEVELRSKLQQTEDTNAIFEQIREIFAIDNPIKVIEVIDNSHTSGGSPVGAIVAAGSDGFIKSRYRIFNMDGVNCSDDYDMMRSILARRFSNSKKDFPDLLVIDGGKGHLNVALRALSNLSVEVPCICVSKGKHRRASAEKFHVKGRTLNIRNNELVFRYMQRLRDEAHRFAISSHRRRRGRRLLQER